MLPLIGYLFVPSVSSAFRPLDGLLPSYSSLSSSVR